MFELRHILILGLFSVGPLLCTMTSRAHAEPSPVSFLRDVAPILVQRCQGCHGAQLDESRYRLDTVERLMRSGEFGETIVQPGAPDDSLLWRLLDSHDESTRMPKEGDRLPEQELARIRGWIEQGAEFDVPDRTQPLSSQLLRPAYPSAPESYPAPIPLTAMAVTPTGDQLAVSGYGEITLWDLHDGSLRSRIAPMTERTTQIVWSPDGSTVAVTGGTPGTYGEVRLLRSSDWSEIRLLDSAADMILTAAFRPDGQQLAVGFPDQAVRIYDVAAGALRTKIEGHADWVTAVAWQSDGKRIVSASRDRTVKVFEAESGDLVVSFSGHDVPALDAIFSADGKLVYSCGANKRVLAWKVEGGSKVAEITSHSDAVHRVLLDRDSLWTVSADRSAHQHKLEDRSLMRRLGDHPDWVTAIALDSAHERVVTGCFNGRVRVTDRTDGHTMLEFTAAPGIGPAP